MQQVWKEFLLGQSFDLKQRNFDGRTDSRCPTEAEADLG